MRIISRQNRSSLTSIIVVEAGEEQPIGTISQKNGIYRAEDAMGNIATKKTKSEALEWLLVQAGIETESED